MVMKTYPTLQNGTLEECVSCLKFITRERQSDVQEHNTQSDKFMSGRIVKKVPTSSTSDDSDRIGDTCRTSTYIYICVDDGSGGAVWRRITAEAF